MNSTRRNFCAIVGNAIASLALGSACSRIGGSVTPSDGRITVRARTDVKNSGAGQIKLGLDRKRDAVLHLPKTARQSPLPLFVMLHGATQSAEDMFWYLGSTHEEAGIAVLAPNSRDTTWDAIGGSFGVDVAYLNRALERVFETTAIDPTRISVGGFSDGASYSLSLGADQRRLLPQHRRILTRVFNQRRSAWEASHLHLTRYARPHSPN